MSSCIRALWALVLCVAFTGCASRMHTWADEPLEQAKQRLLDAPQDIRNHLHLAEMYAQRQDYLRAQQYLSLVETAAGSWSAVGIDADKVSRMSIAIAVRSQQYSEAIRRCRQRLEIEDEPEVRELYAALLEALGEEKEAERQRQLSIRHHPEDARLLVGLARFYERTSRPDKSLRARTLYERYLVLSPEGPDATKVRKALRAAQLEEDVKE